MTEEGLKHMIDELARLTSENINLKELVEKVNVGYAETFCEDVNGVNWFDRRDELMKQT